MDEQRMTTGVRPARKEAAGRRRRAAQFSAARQLARTRPSDDPAHGSSSGSSSGSDSSSGSSSPSVGLSDAADDEAEEEGPRSAASGGQRRGTKQSRTGASPPRRSPSSLPMMGFALFTAMVCVPYARMCPSTHLAT